MRDAIYIFPTTSDPHCHTAKHSGNSTLGHSDPPEKVHLPRHVSYLFGTLTFGKTRACPPRPDPSWRFPPENLASSSSMSPAIVGPLERGDRRVEH
eukprot:scaffold93780_cov69-Phaeocystis_antarctica.AAC.1